jgi:uncharacterized membrane protein YphA (DoxX/SURF4 family)
MRVTRKKPQLQGYGIAVLRVGTGYLFVASGVSKLFIGAPSDPGSLLPVPIVVVSSLGELLCGAALVVGLLTRWTSL